MNDNKKKNSLAAKFVIGFIIMGIAICTVTTARGYTQYKSYIQKQYNDTAYDIAEIFEKSHLKTQILAASFKTAKEVLDVAVAGCHSATIGSSIMKMLISHTTTDTSIIGFERDWRAAFGETTLLKLLKK